MSPPKKSPRYTFIFILIAFTALLFGLLTGLVIKKIVMHPVACTADAMLCPDGSSVGRSGPNCTFAPCPSEKYEKLASTDSSTWKTLISNNYHFTIKYPSDWKTYSSDQSMNGPDIDNSERFFTPIQNSDKRYMLDVFTTKNSSLELQRNLLTGPIKKTTIGTIEGYKTSNVILFTAKDNIYRFQGDDSIVFQEIVSTFRLIP